MLILSLDILTLSSKSESDIKSNQIVLKPNKKKKISNQMK